MRRRIIAAVAAVLLALVGAVLLLSYVAGADRRAAAGMQTTPVLVATSAIPKGTAVAKVRDMAVLKSLPRTAVAAGTLSSLASVSGQVTTTDIQPGEQVFASNFADRKTLLAPGQVTVPNGMQQISVMLESERVLGGHLSAGSTVGVFISLKDKTQTGYTHLTLQKVLVTAVQGTAPTASPTTDGSPTPSAQPAYTGNVMVTLALMAPDAEKVVYAAEYGTIWLSLEPSSAKEGGTRIVAPGNVYK
ncbi:Flp pilus assembly protein CpaB [Allobranchiibius huperziae]|uniref:Flp pilus assembly protein CpaB n=1 Tax=Allobranchiibius huperziae TaxID=1874116 RepID=UPI0015CBBA92